MAQHSVPDTMAAMRLTGHGGIDALVHDAQVPVPRPAPGEVLVRVTATAKNNTDRKAREGLYPTRDKGDVTSFAIGGAPTLTFPRIQGADIVGRVAAVGDGVDAGRIGERFCVVGVNNRADVADCRMGVKRFQGASEDLAAVQIAILLGCVSGHPRPAAGGDD